MLKKALTAIILGLAIVTEATAGSIKYTYAGNDYGEWGTKKKETYDVAIRIDNPALIGKKITAVNASIFAIEGMKDSNRKCNWHFLTPPQGKAARRGG